jgi:membrane protease YdiL (CAAX protease family)
MMKVKPDAPTIAALLYVIATSVLLGNLEMVGADPTSLEVRYLSFVSRYIGYVPSVGSKSFVAALISEEELHDLARKNLDDNDRLPLSAISILSGQKQLVPLFAGPIAEKDSVARLLVSYAFEPHLSLPQDTERLVMESPLPPHLSEAILGALYLGAGNQELAKKAQERLKARARATFMFSLLVAGVFAGVFVLGLFSWFYEVRRIRDSEELPPLPAEKSSIFLKVFSFFFASILTLGILLGPLLASSMSASHALLLTYILTGILGFFFIYFFGRAKPTGFFATIGLKDFTSHTLLGGLHYGLKAFAMLWPITFATAFFWAMIAKGSGVFSNPIVHLLVKEPDITPLFLAVVFLAPLVEEPIFRGFLYGGLREHMSETKAGIISSLIFAAAHMSFQNFLPLVAIGFTFCIAYERSRSLLSSMIAHSLWNLTETLLLIIIFRQAQ